MRLANKLNLPDYQVVAYTKKGVSLTGYLKNSENGIVCEAPGLILEEIVSYEYIAKVGKKVTQFLVKKQVINNKRATNKI